MVWTLTLQPESEGPSLISYAARLLSGGHGGLLSAPSWRTIIRVSCIKEVSLSLFASARPLIRRERAVFLHELIQFVEVKIREQRTDNTALRDPGCGWLKQLLFHDT